MITGSGGGGGGKGGGGKTSRQPREAKNSLFSTSYAKVLDLLGEGEIAGLVNGDKSIYLNNTPLQNADGTYNFTGITVATRNGTQGQSYIPGFDEIISEVGVGVTVIQSVPITRTITTSSTNAVRLTITLPALQKFSSNGDIKGTSVDLAIAVQYNGGGFTTVVSDQISGRTSQQYQRQYLVPIAGAFPVDIRVTRLTADSTSAKLSDAFSWSSYQPVSYAKLSYPNSALVGLRVDAEQFSSIPSRSYRVRGLKVAIPNNATVDSVTGRLIYSGIWTGTFGAAQWTSDPAWCLWSLLTSSRFGLGDYLNTSNLDRWAFYSASQYASALVPDGFGGTEPRFSCSINIQTPADAYKAINDLSSVLRVMPYWSAGSLTIAQDRPADPSFLFSQANVGPEGFAYSNSSLRNRPTVAVVRYFDLDLRDAAFEVVEDTAGISKYGVTKVEIDSVACTSRGQASRAGKWLLYSEANAEVVSFSAALDAAAVVRPGQIIEIADSLRAGSRRSGRIAASTTTAITLDDATGLAATNSPTLSVILGDATVQVRPVVSIVGAVVTVSPAFSAAPPVNGIWLFESSNILASTWRVLAIEERDGTGCVINALAYNASKYDSIELGLALQTRDTTDLNALPDSPQNLTASEILYENSGRVSSKVALAWGLVPGVNSYQVAYRPADGVWQTVTTTGNSFEILDVILTTYEVRVSSTSASLLTSLPALLTVTTYGKAAPPSSPTGLSLVAIDQASAILSWDLAPDLDVRLGGKVLIRHSPATSGATWESATELVPSAAGGQTQKQIPLLTGTVLVKFEDDSGYRSVTEATVVVTLPAPQPRLLVTTYAEEIEPFLGDFTGMAYMPDMGGIALIGGEPYIDSLATDNNFDGLTTFDALGGPVGTGEYGFGSNYDLGAVFDVNLARRLVTIPYLPASLWDDRTGDLDSWPIVEEVGVDRVNAATWVRTTLDNPSGAPTWGPWREFANAIVRARGLQFKAVAASTDASQSIIITELGATLELQQRVEASGTLTTGAAAYAVTFDAAFYQAPSVGITAYGLASTEQFTITGVSTTGFTVTFSDGAGSLARQFAYNAVGYGKAI